MSEDITRRITEKAMRDVGFREQLRKDPRGVLASELRSAGFTGVMPADVDIRVIEQAPNTVYLYIPTADYVDKPAPAGTGKVGWSDSWVSETFGTHVCHCS